MNKIQKLAYTFIKIIIIISRHRIKICNVNIIKLMFKKKTILAVGVFTWIMNLIVLLIKIENLFCRNTPQNKNIFQLKSIFLQDLKYFF